MLFHQLIETSDNEAVVSFSAKSEDDLEMISSLEESLHLGLRRGNVFTKL